MSDSPEAATFRLLDHTADIRAECHAPSFPLLLEMAACALYAIAMTSVRSDAGVERIVTLQADGFDDLLVRWLQELIYLLDVDRFVAVDCAFVEANDAAITARLSGYHCDPEERATEVKAATYHGAAVRQTPSGWTAEVLFDL